MELTYHRITRHAEPAEVAMFFGISIMLHALLILFFIVSIIHTGDRLNEQKSSVITVFLKDAIEGRGRKSEAPKPAVVKVVPPKTQEVRKAKKKQKTIVRKDRPAPRKQAKSPPPKPVAVKAPPPKVKRISPVAPVEKPAPAPVPEQHPAVASPVPLVPEEIRKPFGNVGEVPPVLAMEKKAEVKPPMPAVVEKEPEKPKPPAKPEPEAVKPAEQPPKDVPVKAAPVHKKTDVEQKPVKPVAPEVSPPVKTAPPPPAPVAPETPVEPEKKPEPPTKAEAAPVDENPALPPRPEEKTDASPVSEMTNTEIARETVPEPIASPAVAETDKRERERGADDMVEENALFMRNLLAGVADAPVSTAEPKDSAAEKPAEEEEPKAPEPVEKKKIAMLLHKLLGLENEPRRRNQPAERPDVKITDPAGKQIGTRVQGISGWVKGNGITRVVLSINGESVTVPVVNGRFYWEGALRDGNNTISASVWDRDGYSAKDQVRVEAKVAKNSFTLSLDEPKEGEVGTSVITVKGRVEDRTVEAVKLSVNRETIETAASNGLFEKTLFLKERVNLIQAEAVNAMGRSARSGTLKITVANFETPVILMRLLWEETDIELRPELSRRTRNGLDEKMGVYAGTDTGELMSANNGYREKLFTLQEAKEGAYFISIAGGHGTRCLVLVTVYPDDPSKRRTRLFGPVLVTEEGTTIGRLLMPEGVFWDEDEWFTGMIEEGDSIMKFNTSEGLSWKEMK